MPSVEDNVAIWNSYDWSQHGDEWSRQFGNTEAMWWFVIYPRIHRFVPARTILEIAPGHGRWTNFLRHLCDSLIVVDITASCIDACRARFCDASNISYNINDGKSLECVPDSSVDFVFSFDSLVHVDRDVLETYLSQLARKLTPDGVGFIHHSNLGRYRRRRRVYQALPNRFGIRRAFHYLASLNESGWRSPSVTAEDFMQGCRSANLCCISQELINWYQGKCMIDAISVFTRSRSKWDAPYQVVANPNFVEYGHGVRKVAALYTALTRPVART